MFKDRHEAGQKLAEKMSSYREIQNGIVLGLPRGGVITAYEVAKALKLPLDIVCPRKVGAPHNPELAIGAILENGEGYFNERLIEQLNIPQSYIDAEVEKEKMIAKKRLELYRKKRPPLDLENKTVILVDDGLATGATMKAAINAVRAEGAERVVVAVPVAPSDSIQEIESMAEETICLETPWYFQAVGQFYEKFSQTEDQEVIDLLK